MTRRIRGCVSGFVAGALWALSGCAGQSEGSLDKHPIPTAEAIARASREPKTADLPTLPDGAGPIDPETPLEMLPTGTGLYYRVLRKGDGKKPGIFNEVLAHYRGTLESGAEFDSSYRRKEPTRFPLNGVIKGWTEGLQLIEEGGMIELEIPAELGYGAKGMSPKIPPNATLHFIVELEKVY